MTREAAFDSRTLPYHSTASLGPPVSIDGPTLGFQAKEDGLTLGDLLDLAARQHPELAAARARAEAARGQLVQAGLYPNPVLSWRGDNIGTRAPGAGAGTEGPLIMQQFVWQQKLRLAQGAAAQGVAAAEWQAITRWFDVVTRVRLAFFEALTAQEQVTTTGQMVHLAEKGLEAARALQKAGAGTQPDVLQAQVEVEHNQARWQIAQQRLEAARRLLAAAVGLKALPTTKLQGTLATPAPRYEWESVLAGVQTRSAEIQEALANIMQAEQLALKARADRVPNVTLTVRPFYSFIDHDLQFLVQADVPTPIFNRNQGNIQSAQADLARTHQELRVTELRLTERLTTAYQRYQAALTQKEALEKRIIPYARAALELIELGYKRGDPKYDYATLLQAQRTLVQARLTEVQAQGDLWKAASEIAGLLQLDPE